MRNKFEFYAVISITTLLILGCGFGRRSNDAPEAERPAVKDQTLTDKAVDKTVGVSKIGVPECDEVMDEIEAEINNSDDNFVSKAVKATFLNRLKDGIRKSVEDSRGDTIEMAKTCKEFKMNLDKYKAEEEEKKSK